MKNRWMKMLFVLLIGLMCIGMSACQNSAEKAEDDSDVEITVVETVEEDVPADTDPITEQDVIEESTAVYDEEFLGAEESEFDEIETESISDMEDVEAESAEEESTEEDSTEE